MSSLRDAMGSRDRYLRRAWNLHEPGRYGCITLEEEGGNTFFSFYLLLDGVWKRLAFKRDNGVAEIYQAVSSGTVIEVGMEEGSPRPRLQLLIEVDGRSCWWLIY